MKEYKVTCWASKEIVVEAENEEEAKLVAYGECRFSYVDYCEVSEF